MIRGRAGPLTIVAKRPLPGTERVYNLTVEGEHVYYVSELGLLAHNNCPDEILNSSSSFNRITTPWQRRVYQRADVDWDFIRPEGVKLGGQTDRTAAQQGYTPVRVNPNTGAVDDVVLHHVLDDPRGAVVETWR